MICKTWIILAICTFNIIHAPTVAKEQKTIVWTEKTVNLQNKMIKLWYSKDLSRRIIDTCKLKAKDPRHCVVTASFIGKAESNAWQNAYKNNVFGINIKHITYKTEQDNLEIWMKSYNKKWYTMRHPNKFYSKRWTLPYTHYCTSETSSNSKVWCPRWLEISTQAFNFLSDDRCES